MDDLPTIELQTSLGFIKGKIFETKDGKRVAKFLGIPYAEQPVGALRFKPLQPLELPIGTKAKIPQNLVLPSKLNSPKNFFGSFSYYLSTLNTISWIWFFSYSNFQLKES